MNDTQTIDRPTENTDLDQFAPGLSQAVKYTAEDPFEGNIKQLLAMPLDNSKVAKRRGPGGMELSYLETHFVIKELNEVFGFDGWKDRFHTKPLDEKLELFISEGELECLVDGEWVVHSGEGFGITRKDRNGAINAEAIEMAYKGAASDAIKRAARKFGDRFGNCLYDKDYLAENAAELNLGSQPAPRPAPQAPAPQAPPQTQQAPVSSYGDNNPDYASAPPTAPVRGPMAYIQAVQAVENGGEAQCPRCGGGMWDNRFSKKSPSQPDFKCKNKDCVDEKGWTTSLFPPRQ